MAQENVQFNAVIPDELAHRVRKEAVEHSATLGDVTAQALIKFLALPKAHRRACLEAHKKILGRKIAA